MMIYSVVCCLLLWYTETSMGCGAPRYNFSIYSLQNQTGHWYAEKIQLDHEGGNPWNIIVNTTSDNLKCSQSIFITGSRDLVQTNDSKISTERKNPPVPGYEKIEDLGYYKVHIKEKTWHEARKICEQEGAHLYVLKSKHEAEAVNALVEKSGKSRNAYWIGVHDQFKEGNYITIFDEPFQKAEYMLWHPGGTRGENCGCIDFSGTEYGFCDFGCDNTLIFICQQEL